MPIVDGRYETKISTTYASVEQGLAELKKMIQKSRRIRISNIPMSLLRDLTPLLQDKDLKIILPLGENPTDELRQIGQLATTKARIYVEHRGIEANSGSVNFSSLNFSIVWINDRILDISIMEYGKCVKCLAATFEGGWGYSQKW